MRVENNKRDDTSARGRRLAVLALALVGAAGLTVPDAATAQEFVPLVSFVNPVSGDYFTTSQEAWTCTYFRNCPDGRTIPSAGYRVDRMQGYVFNPARPRPLYTWPLWHWFNPHSFDNLLTSDPFFDPELGTVRTVATGRYEFVRLAGYVFEGYSSTEALGLFSYSNGVDLATLTTARRLTDGTTGGFDGLPAGYTRGRLEGILIRPNAPAFQRCLGNNPATATNPEATIPAPMAPWTSPQRILHGDTLRIYAPDQSYRIDYWGTSKSIRGEAGRFPLGALINSFGLRRFALVAQVRRGRVFVDQQGWFEAEHAFVALGTTSGTAPGNCIHVDLTGVEENPGLYFAFNDPVWWDNGGSARITVRQWY